MELRLCRTQDIKDESKWPPLQTTFSWTNTAIFMMTWWIGNIFRVTAICAGNSPISGESPAQRPVTRGFDVFFDLRLIKRLSKHSRGWWFETLSRPLLRHCNVLFKFHWDVLVRLQLSGVVPKAGIKGRHKWLHPTDTVGWNYLSLPLIPASGTTLFNWFG